MGGCRGDALEGPLPFVDERADDDAIIELKAPGGGARGGGGSEEEMDAEPDADADDGGRRLGAERIDE